MLVGLDGSGKTTLLQVLARNVVQAHEPTTHPQSEEVTVHNVRFQAFDLGGHKAARVLWKRYYPALDGIVFLVDAADPDRFEEARAEIGRLLDAENTVPLLVLGNKVDARGAVSRPTLLRALALDPFLADRPNRPKDFGPGEEPPCLGPVGGRPIELAMCSVVRRWGYDNGFAWLANNLPKTS
jgi:GTP-binding protein SAR1